jgi:hypothetical protein
LKRAIWLSNHLLFKAYYLLLIDMRGNPTRSVVGKSSGRKIDIIVLSEALSTCAQISSTLVMAMVTSGRSTGRPHAICSRIAFCIQNSWGEILKASHGSVPQTYLWRTQRLALIVARASLLVATIVPEQAFLNHLQDAQDVANKFCYDSILVS